MKRRHVATIIGAALVATAGTAGAQDAKVAEAKAKQSGCLECHAVSSKKVGPSFKELAQKFPKQGDKLFAAVKADKDHQEMLKDVKDDDLKLIVNWIASL